MTSLVTTLTLLMAFNAIVFVGVKGQDDCMTIRQTVASCIINKWSSVADMTDMNDRTVRSCCRITEENCALNRVKKGSDGCESIADRPERDECEDTVTNVRKRCPDLTTNPIEGNCKNYVKYMNCFGNTSSHLMSRPLIVFTPIVTLFVIYFFN